MGRNRPGEEVILDPDHPDFKAWKAVGTIEFRFMIVGHKLISLDNNSEYELSNTEWLEAREYSGKMNFKEWIVWMYAGHTDNYMPDPDDHGGSYSQDTENHDGVTFTHRITLDAFNTQGENYLRILRQEFEDSEIEQETIPS